MMKVVIGISWLLVCVLASPADIYSQYGQFNGGSMSFGFDKKNSNGTWMVKVDVITGWKLGMGPCGLTCNKSSVGLDTTSVHNQVLLDSGDPLYLGNWTLEYKAKTGFVKTKTESLNDYITQSMTEKVIAVSERALWEQEWMTYYLPLLDDVKYEDINFDGSSWRNLSMQGENKDWHIQVKITPSVRDDTKKPNSSPQALSKPFYRLLLNNDNWINIAATDPDGDYVQCYRSLFVEGGHLGSHPLPNIQVFQNCTVLIPTQESLGYSDGSWGAVAITVRDYNKKEIVVGGSTVAPGDYGLSAISVDFLIQTLSDLKEPVFVPPSPKSQHKFVLYSGSVWTIEMCAEAVSPNKIAEFVVTGRQQEPITTAALRKDQKGREGTKCTEISWDPTDKEVGEHIFCVMAEDDQGMDTSEDSCYKVEVKVANFTAPSGPAGGIPVFVYLPEPDELICEVESTCVFPVYVQGVGGAAVTDIQIKKAFVSEYHLSNITSATTKCTNCYTADLYVRHDQTDKIPDICVQATDENGLKSTVTCVQPTILPKDPCSSMPCHNGGVCKRNPSDPGDFFCRCSSAQFSGKDCSKEASNCDSNPCVNGPCRNMRGPKFYCTCDPGWTGRNCDVNVDDCTPDPCKGRGKCKDELNSHTCECYRRYNGSDCGIDLCPSEPPTATVCPLTIPGCASNPCHGHGICQAGGSCVCSSGYAVTTNPTCDAARIESTSKIAFVPPTLPEGSVVSCYSTAYCKIRVYFTQSSAGNATLTAVSQSPDVTPTFGPISAVTDIPGLQNVYSSEITLPRRITGTRYVCIEVHDSSSKSGRRCFQLMFVSNPAYNKLSPEYNARSAPVKFSAPTPESGTHFFYPANDTYRFFVYTSKTTTCEQVLCLSPGVNVFPTTDANGVCTTELTFSYPTEGEQHKICVLAADGPTTIIYGKPVPHGQTRCYYVDVTVPGSAGPCVPDPCQNDGVCLSNGTNSFSCICGDKYTGIQCEKGPCPSTSHTCTNGYCTTDNGTESCACNIGYDGPACSHNTPKPIGNPDTEGAKFTDGAIPKTITCVRNKPCSIPFAVSGKYTAPDGPILHTGYQSPSLQVDSINTSAVSSPDGIYRGSVQLIASKSGHQHLCVQTLRKNGVNEDELCFDVDVSTDTSNIFGDTNKPHFIAPSVPANSRVRCEEQQPCHILVHATPGRAHAGKCTSVDVTEGDLGDMHAFSECSPCVEDNNSTNNDCEIDVSITPDVGSIGDHSLCIEVSLVSDGLKGEKRCFQVTVETAADHKVTGGCKNLHCENKGFCDGHIAADTTCHCPLGFTGNTCQTDNTGTITPTSNAHEVTEIDCSLGETCTVPFKVTGSIVQTGHVDPSLAVGRPTVTTSSPPDTHGNIQVTPSTPGVHQVCVQSFDPSASSTVKDEKCVKVTVKDKVPDKVDTTRPHFLDPTLPKDSKITCEPNKACHIIVHTSKGAGGECPGVTEQTGVSNGLHIFPVQSSGTECTVDVSYIPPTTKLGNSTQLCLQVQLPGIKGEERCITTAVANNVVVNGPCKGQSCKNGGKGIADVTKATCDCICPSGFSGSDCSNSNGKSNVLQPDLTGISVSNPPVFSNGPIPDSIVCHTAQVCKIPLPITGDPSKTPRVQTGHTDPALTPGVPSVTPGSVSGTYTAVVPVTTPGTPGVHRLCVQTADPVTGINVDESCFNVNVTSSGSATHNPSLPGIINSIPDKSSVICHPTEPCHIVTSYNKGGSTGACPDLIQTTHVANVVPLEPVAPASGNCDVDTVFTPPTTMTGTTQHVCLQPRGSDQTTCYNIDVTNNKPTLQSPCKDLHCQHGTCVAGTTDAVCSCSRGFTGKTCNTAVTPSLSPGVTNPGAYTDPTMPKIDGTSSIPKLVQCEVGKECTIPLVYHGDNTHMPTPGHVDPGLGQAKTSAYTGTPGLPAGTHISKTTVTPVSAGSHRMCIQTTDPSTGTNVDEVCLEVNVSSSGSTPTVPPTKPQFVSPSLTDKAEVFCPASKTCHMPIITKQIPAGTCPGVTECGTGSPGVYAYATKKQSDGNCLTDLTFTPRPGVTDADLCVSSGPNGENREIKVHVNSTTVSSPCQSTHCENGVCVAGTSDAVCNCKQGFTGTTCNTPVTPSLPAGVTDPTTFTDPNMPKIDGTSSIPNVVQCEVGKECTIPLVYHGDATHLPTPGHVDPGLGQAKTSAYTSSPGLPPGTHISKTTVTPVSSGSHRICIQTTDQTTGTNADEVCLQVNVKAPGTIPTSPPNQPHFISPSLTDKSEVLCEASKTCHIPIVTSQVPPGKCPPVSECGTGNPGVHAYPTKQQTNGHCLTDVTYTPRPGVTDADICVSSGPNGEERQIKVHSHSTPISSPCQSLHCKHGVCVAGTSDAVCNCKQGYTGTTCDTGVPPTMLPGVTDPATFTDPNMPKIDGTSGIPKIVQCEIGKPCTIPLVYHGDSSHLPTPGHVDPGLGEAKTSPYTGTPALPGNTHISMTTVNPVAVGNHRICIQTTDDVKRTNVDEVCLQVKVSSSGSSPTAAPNTPQFSSPSLTSKSEVLCEAGKTCHIPVITTQVPVGTCPAVVECGTGSPGVFVYATKPQSSGRCIADLTYTPRAGVTDASICVSAGPNGEERIIKAHVGNVKDTGPCQKLHCENGGVCEASSSTAVCNCPHNYKGSTCHDQVATVPDRLGGATGAPVPGSGTPKLDGAGAIPDTIKCEKGKPCTIPMIYQGSKNNPPVPGHVDPGLGTVKTDVVDTVLPGNRHISQTTFTPTKTGQQRMCLRTTQSGSTVDETCFKVDVDVPATSTPPQNKPHFSPTCLTTGSTVQCEPGQTCHIPIITDQKSSGGCSQVGECGTGVAGVHAFKPKTMSDGTCLTDFTYTAKPATTGVKPICISSGPNGETKVVKVKVSPIAVTSPCVPDTCQNGGFCDAVSSSSICVCKTGYSGLKCGNDGGTTFAPVDKTDLTSSKPPVFTDTATPVTVVCYQNKACQVPFKLTGDPNKTPDLQIVNKNPDVTSGTPTVVPAPAPAKPGQYNAVLPVTATGSSGTRRICAQTVDPTDNVNVDEVCFQIEVHSGTPPTSGFQNPTLPGGSTVECKADSTCHLVTHYPAITGVGANKCPDLEQASPSTVNVHIFPPTLQGGSCVVDTALTPSSSLLHPPSSPKVCLQPKGGSQRCYHVDVTSTPQASGCKTLHCFNNGTCDSSGSSVVCHCAPGFTGLNCKTIAATTTPATTSAAPTNATSTLAATTSPTTKTTTHSATTTTTTTLKPTVHSSTPTPQTSTSSSTQTTTNPTSPTTPTTTTTVRRTSQSSSTLSTTIPTTQSSTTPTTIKQTSPTFTTTNSPTPASTATTSAKLTSTAVPTSSAAISTSVSSSTAHARHSPSATLTSNPASQTTAATPATSHSSTTLLSLTTDASTKSNTMLSQTASSTTPQTTKPTTGSSSSTPIATTLAATSSYGSTGAHTSSTNMPTSSSPSSASTVHSSTPVVSSSTRISTASQTTSIKTTQQTSVPSTAASSTILASTVKSSTAPTSVVTSSSLGSTTKATTGATTASSSQTAMSTPKVTSSTAATSTVAKTTASTLANTVASTPLKTTTRQTTAGHSTGSSSVPTLTSRQTTSVTSASHASSSVSSTTAQTTKVTTAQTNGGSQTTVVTASSSSSPATAGHSLPATSKASTTHSPTTVTNEQQLCAAKSCQHGAICKAYGGQAICHCRLGYSGDRCNSATPEIRQGLTPTQTDRTPPAFISPSQPSVIMCVMGKECHVPLEVTHPGTGGAQTKVVYGHVDPGLVTKSPGVVCTTVGPSLCHVTVLLTPVSTGNHTMCVQTTDSTGANADELCYTVHVNSGSSPTPTTSTTHFEDPSLPSGSTITCAMDKTCHYPVTVKIPPGSNCTSIQPSTGSVGTVYVGDTRQSGTDCTTDIIVTPEQTGTKGVCVELQGRPVEKHCIFVQTPATLSPTDSSCRSLRCQHGGRCDTVGGVGVCVCEADYSGLYCEKKQPEGKNVSTTGPSVFIGNLVPSQITCHVNEACSFPLLVSSKPPGPPPVTGTLGPINPVVTPVDSACTGPVCSYNVKVPVAPTSPGHHTLCIHTTDGNSGANMDEVCLKVNVPSGPAPATTCTSVCITDLPRNAVVECTVGTSCRMPITTHVTSGSCPDIQPAVGSALGMTVMNRNSNGVPPNIVCSSHVVVTPRPGQTGSKQVCLSAKTTVGSDDRCYTVTVKDPDVPCTRTAIQTSQKAREMVKAGKASCRCKLNGTWVQIIKRKPVATKSQLFKSAGIGAGGGVGTMALAVGIYFIVTKVRKMKAEKKETRRRPSPRARARVHPDQRRN